MEWLVQRLRDAGCVFAEDEARILSAFAGSDQQLTELVAARIAGRPLEHLVGYAEFAGLRIAVDPGVFVPRRRSELLVAETVRRVRHGDIVVDLCCGSGAVGAAIVASAPGIELHAVDLDPAAAACAERNLARHGATVYTGDLIGPLPPALRGRVDVIVANAPYVPTADIEFMPTEARDHEARVALDGGADGVDVHRRIAKVAADWLRPSGVVLIETSDRQAVMTSVACSAAGLAPTVVRDDDLDATVVVARKPAA